MKANRRVAAVWFAPAVAIVVGVMTPPATAYNPPVDTAGPLVVRIEGPEQVTRCDVPLPVEVTVENQSASRIEGTVELGLIDRWRSEPAGAVKLAVEPHAKSTATFRVVADRGTYSAHYPIHAFARFQVEGKALVAHPILVLQTNLPTPPRPAPSVAWKPVAVPASGELALWRLPVVRAVIAVFGKEPQTMPAGWQGSEERTGGSMRVQSYAASGDSRDTVAIHPPWQNGLVGTLAAEYPLVLPKSTPLKLSFANAVIPEGHGDGVTFRVRAVPIDAPAGELGKIVFERHTASKKWEPGQADLGAFAGQTVRLQLESHPGPKNDTGWDSSFWAEPVLSAGTPDPPAPFPPQDDTGSRMLGTVGRGLRTYEVLAWPGRRGLLDAAVGFRQDSRTLYFRGFEVRVLGGRIDDARSPILLVEVKDEPTAQGIQLRHRLQSHLGPFDLVGRLWVESDVLRARFQLENVPAPQPWQVVWLEDVAAGPFSDTARQVYAGVGNVIREPGAFRLGFDGHQLSSSFVGLDFAGGTSLLLGVDVPPDHFEVNPGRRHYSLHAPHRPTYTFIPARDVWEAVRLWRETNGLKPAAGVPKAAGRFVFDLWGGRYRPTADSLQKAFRYGLTDAMVIFHDWQRWGYDYRLPDIYPPNPQYGTLDDLRRLVAVCKQAGVLVALHDNYIDSYPDSDGFSYERDIAFTADGQPVRAWNNEWRKAQSYRFRADRVEPYLRRNLQWIKGGLGPTAHFIDVWSSIGPYDYWTADGKFYDRVYTRTSWGEQFAWIRELLGDNAPQISESGHDQLIGWLDGAQTNHLRVGKTGPVPRWGSWCVWDIPHGDAERVPWLDAAHHDRFILHGAGYPGRYEGGLEPKEHGIYSDDYVTTEVLTGHPGMVPDPFNRQVVRKYWLLADLMRTLALRRIEAVYFVDGDLHRQRVHWSGGASVAVNRGPTDWKLAGAMSEPMVLPQYGFSAWVPATDGTRPVEASICRREGLVVEMSRSGRHLYVNARQYPNAKPTDFGPIVTVGGCRLTREGETVIVTPLPEGGGANVTARIRWAALGWNLPEPTHVEALSDDGRVLRREPVARDGDAVAIGFEPGVFSYRFVRQ
jgi:hypothetical protein